MFERCVKLSITKHKSVYRFFLLTVVYTLLTACSVFGVRSEEEIKYKVISKQDDFEIREYDSYIKAYTNIDRAYKNAGRIGFNRLFDYISGYNQAQQKISMTAPVIINLIEKPENNNVKINMTAPVLVSQNKQGWQYSFVMPSFFTIENTPKPLDENVKLMAVAKKTVAVYSFNGLLDEDEYQANSQILKRWLKENDYSSVSSSYMAGFDPPWTLPMFRRNEMLIDIKR
mgnify:CR=1 FL=1